MEGDQARTLQLELVVLFESSDDGLRILADNGKVINIDSYVLIMIINMVHPDVGFGLAWIEAHLMQAGSKSLMPSPSR